MLLARSICFFFLPSHYIWFFHCHFFCVDKPINWWHPFFFFFLFIWCCKCHHFCVSLFLLRDTSIESISFAFVMCFFLNLCCFCLVVQVFFFWVVQQLVSLFAKLVHCLQHNLFFFLLPSNMYFSILGGYQKKVKIIESFKTVFILNISKYHLLWETCLQVFIFSHYVRELYI